MIGKLVASALAGSNVGNAIGPILTLGEHIGNAADTLLGGPMGVLQSTANWIGGGSGVGGVLFDKAAECLTDLEEITGAYWDEKLGQIVLVGKKNGNTEELCLPKMDKDHLAVAMRATFSGDNLGVSIDPPPGYLESGRFPSDGTLMDVRYLGNTKDTLFGAIMFEADRLLKTLSMGTDNITHAPVTSQVPGFQNELELSLTMGTQKPNTWHRMWFVIEDIKLNLPVKESADRNSIKFGKAAIKVKAEYISKEKNPGADPVAARFADHFTLQYDSFAKESPVLERLKELAKISAIVKWLKNSGKHVDLSFLNDYDFIKVPTPEKTPGITAAKSQSWQSGNVTHTQTYALYGGVDFDFHYQSIKDDVEAPALKKVTQDSKPCETSLAWDFKLNGESQRALAIPMARTNGNYTTSHTDYSLASTNGLKLELVRCYDSFNTKPSMFGFGWTLKIPYEILFINPQKDNAPLVMVHRVTGDSNKYMWIKDKGYFLVCEEKEESGVTSFSYDPRSDLKKNVDGSFIWKAGDGVTYKFNSQGKLVIITDKSNQSINYSYEQNRVVRISDSSGKSICLTYDNKKHVRQAVCPGKKTISYYYGQSGNLIKVSTNSEDAMNYAYDTNHRLIKISDVMGGVTLRKNYDTLGRTIRKRKDMIEDITGSLIVKTYDDIFRPIKEEDRLGNSVSYQYDEENNITKTILEDKWRRSTVFEHDQHERITKILNPLNQSTEFHYDSTGNITSFVDANKNAMNFHYDESGNLLGFQDAMGNQWKQELDHLSRPISITDPFGDKVLLTYLSDGNKLESIESPTGTIQYQYDKKGRISKITDQNGNATELFYDARDIMMGVRDALGQTWTFTEKI